MIGLRAGNANKIKNAHRGSGSGPSENGSSMLRADPCTPVHQAPTTPHHYNYRYYSYNTTTLVNAKTISGFNINIANPNANFEFRPAKLTREAGEPEKGKIRRALAKRGVCCATPIANAALIRNVDADADADTG